MTDIAQGAPVHPADALAADGKAITLTDGRAVTLQYTMGSLRLLETRFGSLQGMKAELDRGQHGQPCPEHREPLDELDVRSGDRKRTPGHGAAEPTCEACRPPTGLFTALSDAIAPALLHERVTHPDTGLQVRLGKDPDLVAELLTPGNLEEYMGAWAAAFGEAMANLGGSGNVGAGQPPASPGPSGTTPPPSFSGAQTNGSGG